LPAFTANNAWQRNFLVLGSCILVVAGLYWAQRLLAPIVLAVLLTFILSPPVSFLQRCGMGRSLSAVMVVFLASGLLIVMGGITVVQLKNLATELPQHEEQIVQKIKDLQEASRDSWLENAQNSIEEFLKSVRAQVSGADDRDDWRPLNFRFESPGLFTVLLSTASPIIETLLYAILVLILVAFMLIHREALRNRLIHLWGHGSVTNMTKAIDDGTRRISRFLLMQLIVNVTVGACLGFGLFLLGVPYASLWGFLAALLRYIPYVGIWAAALLPSLLSIAILPGWGAPLFVLGLFAVVEIVTANVVEPLVYGQSIGVSEVSLLISAAFWAWLWGPFGLVLAAPLTACLAVLGRYVPQLEFFSILLGDEPVLAPHVTWYQRLIAHDEHEAMDVIEEYLRTHPVEEVYEEVLLPGLNLARQHRERGELNAEDEQFILQGTQEAIDELLPLVKTSSPKASGPKASGPKHSAPAFVHVLGCPARDKLDELSLRMFRNILPENLCQLKLVPSGLLVTDMVRVLEENQAELVIIASLSAGGLPHTRYLCKRLRGVYPDLKILVGCWGCPDPLDRSRKRLQDAGVDHIATTLVASRQQLIPLVQFLANATDESKIGCHC
jgi:predicted PurR-regulated permease PerM